MKKKIKTHEIIICLLFAVLSVLSLNMRNTLYEGFCIENEIGNVFSRFYNVFNHVEYLDVIALISFFLFYRWNFSLQRKLCISGMMVSFLLSFSYVISSFYRNFDSTHYMFCDVFQTMMSITGLIGIGIIIYYILNTIQYFYSTKISVTLQSKQTSKVYFFIKNNFFHICFLFILLCWLMWLIMTYPGTTCPDSIVQLENFYGEIERTEWHPPFSNLIMGGLFHLGSSLVNANFGMFLYNLIQSVIGAFVFAFALSRLEKRGVPLNYALCCMLFFGLTPMWGAYAQWFEKDFLYSIFVVLFVTLISEVLFEQANIGKYMISISIAGILVVLLRNNGIYVVLPTMIALCIYFRKNQFKKVLASLAVILLLFIMITKIIYPLIGIGKTSISETIGFMFQATARYVQEYPEEVTEYEKEVLSNNFNTYESFNNYNPRISDPVKICYNHSDFSSYMKIWIKMFFKHPLVYIESYLNGSYGYLAPVSRDIGAYISLADYDPYLSEKGVSHVENGNLNYLAVWLWNINLETVLIKYTVSPGLYTWITIILLWLMIYNKKAKGILLLIPNVINILVCTASPLADAMRYALPTVAVTPMLIGWSILLFLPTDKAYEKVTI